MEIEKIILLTVLAVIVLQLIMIALIVDGKQKAKKDKNVVRVKKKEFQDTGKVVLPCGKCGVKLYVKYDGVTYLCPVCNHKFRLSKTDKK
ncbi:MAG: hypothetical protein IJ284_03750 [Clostridia bacterium]|nr:hypothetical protein [Clostridia bacterium]